MRCQDCQSLFSRHLDGRLSAAEHQALEAHLAGCGGCREELRLWSVPSRAMRAGGPEPVPVGLAARAFRAAMASERRVGFVERFVLVARRAALAGAIATVGAWAAVAVVPEPEPVPQDPMEMAVSLWTAEASFDGE